MKRDTSLLDRTFIVTIALKGADGVLELVGGLLLLALPPHRLSALVRLLTQRELSQDPHDFIATHLVSFAQGLSLSVSLFLVFYLISHGVAKIILVAALFKEKLWAYPWMIAFLMSFIVYQLYRLVLHWSFWLAGLTLFDMAVVALTVIEYVKHRRTT